MCRIATTVFNTPDSLLRDEIFSHANHGPAKENRSTCLQQLSSGLAQ